MTFCRWHLVVTEGMKRRGCEVIVQWDPERVMDHAAEPKQVFI